jgi:hypothetical protein
MLRDSRMVAHDYREGRQLRYTSWCGGIVASML